MKKITIIFAVLFLMHFVSTSAVRTVSNDAAGGAQFSSLYDAYNASANGDTLLVEGTNINYSMDNVCGNYWNRSLVVIGIGFNPQKQIPKRTRFSSIGCAGAWEFMPGASGSKFYGIEFTFGNYFAGTVSNLLFEDCKFNSIFEFYNQITNNIVFNNCIFDWDFNSNIIFSGNGISNANILISNCIFDGFINGNSNSNLTLTMDHCLFLNTQTAFVLGYDTYLNNLQNANIKNCIFMNMISVQGGTSTGNTYLNNISRLGGLPAGSGNSNNINPIFVNYSVGNTYSIGSGFDFHLHSTSPGVGAATDQTDIGVHGGSTNFSESGEPLIVPIVRQLNVNNTNVPPNGTLNIQLHITKPNNN